MIYSLEYLFYLCQPYIIQFIHHLLIVSEISMKPVSPFPLLSGVVCRAMNLRLQVCIFYVQSTADLKISHEKETFKGNLAARGQTFWWN